MKTQPWHSKRASDPKVYHDNDKCPDGSYIDKSNRDPGTGDLPHCSVCERLERQDRDIRGRKSFEEEYHRVRE